MILPVDFYNHFSKVAIGSVHYAAYGSTVYLRQVTKVTAYEIIMHNYNRPDLSGRVVYSVNRRKHSIDCAATYVIPLGSTLEEAQINYPELFI